MLFRRHNMDKCQGLQWVPTQAALGAQRQHSVILSLQKSPREFTVCRWDHSVKWSRSDTRGRRARDCSHQHSWCCKASRHHPAARWSLGVRNNICPLLCGEGGCQLLHSARAWPLQIRALTAPLNVSADKTLTHEGERETFLLCQTMQLLWTFLCHCLSPNSWCKKLAKGWLLLFFV